MKWIKLILLVLAVPLALVVLLVLLGFVLVLSPALTVCFAVWQIVGIFKERSENKMRLEYKLKTNRDYLQFEYKKGRNETT